MATTSERLTLALKLRNMKAVDLHDKTGIGKSSISQYMTGVVKPKQDRIYLMAKALDVDELWLMGHNVPMERRPIPSPRPSKQDATPLPPAGGLPVIPIDDRNFRVPVVGRVAAGQPIIADEEIIGYEYIDDKYAHDGYTYFGLRIEGKSMEPTIMDGDIVIVRRQNYVENGEIAIVLIDGEEATAKEVKESADGITLIGHNAAVYTPHFYSAREVQDLPVQVIGRVVQLVRRFLA